MKQVLAVDDEETVLRVIALALGRVGEVTTAADGSEAIELMKAGRRFDCVVLDLDMPNVGGSEVVTWMKGEEGHRDTPVVLLTAFESADLEQELLAKGARAYLTKPVDPDKLAQLVASLF